MDKSLKDESFKLRFVLERTVYIMEEMLRDLRMLALASNTLRTLSVLRKVIIGLMVAFTALRTVRAVIRLKQANEGWHAGLRTQLHS